MPETPNDPKPQADRPSGSAVQRRVTRRGVVRGPLAVLMNVMLIVIATLLLGATGAPLWLCAVLGFACWFAAALMDRTDEANESDV